MQSDHPVVIGSSESDSKLFPPGFSYRLGGTIYTVKADVTQETGAPMREIVLSDGKIEITPIDSIRKDLRESDCEILPEDKRYVITKPVEKKVAKKKITKKVAKKKVAKKKVKKKVVKKDE